MTRKTLYAWMILTLLLALCGLKSQASGTYARNGGSAFGNGASLAKGEVQFGLKADFQHFTKLRLANGNYQRVLDVRYRTYTLYGEYGLTKNSSLYVAIPYIDNDSDIKAPAYASESGIGDVRVGYTKTFNARKNSSLTGIAEVTIPFRNYSTRKLTAPGDNSVDLLAKLAYRVEGIAGTSLFTNVAAGGKLRASKSPDQWLWDAELGARLTRSASISTFLDSVDSGHGVGLGSQEFVNSGGDYALLKQTVTRLGIRGLFSIGKVNGELYYARAIRFQNQAPGDYYGLSISGRF